MEKLNVYCIIVTYNAMKWLDKCLGSLRESTIPIHPVIIDNSSSDETVEYISTNYPEVHIIINDINRGFGQANNQGIEYAYKQGATHFFLLNQDAWIYEDTIKNLIEVQDKYDIAIVSPIHLNGQGTKLDFNYFSNTIIREQNINFISDLILDKVKPYYSVFKINAAAWMLSKKTIENIGGFDPIYFHYGEDGNYCRRVKFHNEKVAFVPSAFIHHDREVHGNKKVFLKNSTIMWLLSQYSDINKSVWKIDNERLLLHLNNFRLAIVFLFTLKLNRLAYIINGYFKFVFKFPTMIKNMRSNRNKTSNWLNLE